MSEQTILASDLRVITRYLNSQQLDPDAVLTAAGIDSATLSEPRGRVPAMQVGELLNQLVTQHPDRNLGLALAQHHHMTDTHVLGLTAIASETSLDALRRLIRYQALVSSQEPLSIAETDDAVTLNKATAQTPVAEHVIQVFLFAVVLSAIRNISGFQGDIVESASPVLHRAQKPITAVFGPRVRFNGGATGVAPSALEQPISTGNVDILTTNEPLLASLVRAVRENNLPAKIKLAILDQLPDHTLTEEEAAASQNMSLRTFQRRLEDERTDSALCWIKPARSAPSRFSVTHSTVI